MLRNCLISVKLRENSTPESVAGLSMAADPLDCDRQVYQVNVFRKLDLILHRDDGLEYDENGCFPCLPGCRKPLYESGQLITGYLLVRPTRKISITGFSVTFGGRYETSWTEGALHWGSSRVFFSENTRVIKNRHIVLDGRWYRFDFEYQLPKGLPSSLKEPEGRVTYYAYGSVNRPDGPDIDTYDTHFNIKTPMDIDMLPSPFHEPAHRKRLKTYSTDTEVSSEQELSGEYTDQSSIGIREPHVLATLCLSNRAFVIGQHVIADVTIENNTSGNLLCTIRFEQVFIFEAHAAREYCGRDRPPLFISQTRSKATRKNVCKPSVVKMAPKAVEAYNCIFQVPNTVSSTPERYCLSKAKVHRQRDPLIRVKYYVTLVISSNWMEEEFAMPLEIKIGTCDSMSRDATVASLDRELSSPSGGARWDATPNSDEAPPGYEEPYNTTV